jgi:hypothetical protein
MITILIIPPAELAKPWAPRTSGAPNVERPERRARRTSSAPNVERAEPQELGADP